MMSSSICSKKVIDDVVVLYDPLVQTRYVNLQKWAASDAEFVKRVTNGVHKLPHPTVVDSVSCRQMYLRSYTFSKKKEGIPEKMKKCFTKFKEQVVTLYTKKTTKSTKDEEEIEKKSTSALAALSAFRYFTKKMKKKGGSKRRVMTTGWRVDGGFCVRRLACVKRVKDVSCGGLLFLFRKLLYCTTKVDAVA